MRSTFLILASLFLVSCNFSERRQAYKAIKSPVDTSAQNALEKSIQRGAVIYTEFCKQCHQPKGEGVLKTFPPLANSDYLTNKREESIRAVKYGQKGEITVNGVTYNSVMAPMGLYDDEVADVMNYIMNSWGNTQDKMVTEDEVSKISE